MTASETIVVHGARVHNLKGLNVTIPRDRLTVITGLSGSGKSSLAFDTLYAEGQRRYMESMSLHARQFLEQMEKPDVDLIEGLSPAIAIEQKTSSRSPRSTVGTVTEIYDYFRLLYSRIGIPHCPDHQVPIKSQTLETILNHLTKEYSADARLYIYGVFARGDKGTFEKELESLRKKGFSRARIDGTEFLLSDVTRLDKNVQHDIEVAIDRLKNQPAQRNRIFEALTSAVALGKGSVFVRVEEGSSNTFVDRFFNTKAACPVCFYSFPPMSPRLFSFNSPYGMCQTCAGFGEQPFFDPNLLFPDVHESLWDFLGELTDVLDASVDKEARKIFKKFNVALNTPLSNYSKKFREALIEVFPKLFEAWYRNASSDDQTLLDAFRSSKPCVECSGARLCKEGRNVTVNGKYLHEIMKLPITELIPFVKNWSFVGSEKVIASKILDEAQARLHFLVDVGLSYLTLDRSTTTLSGGEAQRVRLASQLGTNLSGVLYILDEPSIGLHPRDHRHLLGALRQLCSQGNTVVLVEHDEETIRCADHLVDIGPAAGKNGGYLIFSGTPEEMVRHTSLTSDYLNRRLSSVIKAARTFSAKQSFVTLSGCTGNNLQNCSVEIPHGRLIAVTGVSGSGKSSLVMETLVPAVKTAATGRPAYCLPYRKIEGVNPLGKVMCIDQKPIGRTPRSNPATYTGIFSLIRDLYAKVPDAVARGYGPGRFSFNVGGGRCETCKGDGAVKLEMMFLPDVYTPCDSCLQRRYNVDTLSIRYREKSIADVLDMTIQEAASFFENHRLIQQKLQTLLDVGLGYLTLGQGSPSLSGGEAQRLKLARELAKTSRAPTLYVLDEPTTGLHFHDVKKLLECLQSLVDRGHTVLVIEHHLDVIASSDWIIEMGPDSGSAGGRVLYCGEADFFIEKAPQAPTAVCLREHLRRNSH